MFNEKLRNTKSYSQREKERKNGIKKETKEERGKHIDQWYIRIT